MISSSFSLILDTSQNLMSVVLLDQSRPDRPFVEEQTLKAGEGEMLPLICDQLLNRHSVSYQQLNRVIVLTGPGSFTGLRIGLSCARALALALSIPVFGLTTLQAHAAHPDVITADYPFHLVILDGKRGDYCYQLFQTKARAASDPLISDKAGLLQFLKDKISGTPSLQAFSLSGHGVPSVQDDIMVLSQSSLLSGVSILHNHAAPGWQALAEIAPYHLTK
jgi:tRNA threonylcarbamoyladenosine biosynthesis protein TsaB